MKAALVLLAVCALSSGVESRSVRDQTKRTLFFPMKDVVDTVVGGALTAGGVLGHSAIGAAEDVGEVGIDVFEQLAEQLLQADSLEATMLKCLAAMGKVGAQTAEQMAKKVVDSLVDAVAAALMQGSSPSAALGQGAGSVLSGLSGEASKCLVDALLGILGKLNLGGALGGALGSATGTLNDILSGVNSDAALTGAVQDILAGLANGSSVAGVGSDVIGGATGIVSNITGDLTSGITGGSGSSNVVSDVVSDVTGGLTGSLGSSNIVSDVVSDVTGDLTSGLTEQSGISNIVNDVVSDVVGDLTSGLTGSSGSSNIVSDVVSGSTGLVGGLISGGKKGSSSGSSGLGGLLGKRK